MNKLFTKIATFAIGAFMAVGVGVAASVNAPEVSAAHAANESVTLDLSNSNNRTSFSTSQQVWSQNGITLTNNKGSSTSNVADYTPPRFYKSSTIIISCALGNISKIDFVCSESKYATALENSIAESTASGSNVSWELDGTTSEVVATMTGGQVRMGNSLTVYYVAAGSGDGGETETPTIPVTSVALNQYEATLEIGQTVNLTATVSPAEATNPTVTWSSSAEAIASVDNNGVVTAKSTGTANITATADGKTSTACVVTVNEAPAVEGEKTASVTIADYAHANSWADATKYTSIDVASIDVDSNITATVTGGSNTGKYYENGENWRLYQGESATLTISVSGNHEIKTVKVTYSVSNSGTLKLNSTNIASNTVVDVNAKTVTFNVGNTGSATNGQVRVTAIEVVYYPVGERIPTKLSAEWNADKGTYYNSDRNNIFSTADLVVTSLTSDDEIVDTFIGGTGFTVSVNETTLNATSEVQTLDVSTMTAGEYTLTVRSGELTPATLTINIVDKNTISLDWDPEAVQADTFVSYVDALRLQFKVKAQYNDGSASVSNENITAVLYEGDSNKGTQIKSFDKAYSSYRDGFNVTADDGILADNTINKRLAYAEAKTFYLEVYVTNYPAVKLGKVLNVVMPTMEVSDANDFNYYVGSEYDLAANARLVYGDKVRELDADEFTLDKETVNPENTNDITVTATFNDNTNLTADYTITPKAPVTVEAIEVYDNYGEASALAMFDAGDEFKLFNAADAEYFLHAKDSEENNIYVNTYADITFVIADDAEGTNSKTLEVGDTMFMGMDGKHVIVTYTQGESSASTSYELMIAEAEAITYEAPTTGGAIVKATSIEVGDVVYLVCKTETESMQLSGISTTSTKYGTGVAYTTTPDSETYPLTVVAGSTSGTYALKNEDGLYLYWTSGNSLNVNATLNEETSWTVDFDEGGNAIIQNYTSGDDSTEPRRIAWNINSPRFANYQNSTLDDSRYTDDYATVQIYKSNATAGNGVDYIQSVVDTFRLNSTLQNEYGLSICNDDSKIYASGHWTIVKEVYEGLSEADKAILSSTHDKYAADENVTYADTMDMLIANDTSTSQLFGVAVLKGKSSDVILVITLISITATVLVVGYVLNKKRVSNSK